MKLPVCYAGAAQGQIFRVTRWCKLENGSAAVVVSMRRRSDMEVDRVVSARLAPGLHFGFFWEVFSFALIFAKI